MVYEEILPPMAPSSLILRCRCCNLLQGGYAVIIEAIEKLGEKHAEHIAAYGEVRLGLSAIPRASTLEI